MKKILSVLGLAACSTLPGMLVLMVLLAAVQSAAFFAALRTAESLEYALSSSRMAWIGGAGFAALCALVALVGCDLWGSRVSLTLRRLRVSERCITLAWGGYFAACFAVLWAWQMGVALLLCTLGAQGEGLAVGLAFYRDRFLHSLLPMADASRWVRNAALCVSLGLTAACFSFRQRQGKKGLAFPVLASLTLVVFSQSMGNFASDAVVTLVALFVTGTTVWGLWLSDEEEEEPHA